MVVCCYAVSIILSVMLAECRKLAVYTECHNAECYNAECLTMLSVIMLSVIMMIAVAE
jgi:hypothetical protein